MIRIPVFRPFILWSVYILRLHYIWLNQEKFTYHKGWPSISIDLKELSIVVHNTRGIQLKDSLIDLNFSLFCMVLHEISWYAHFLDSSSSIFESYWTISKES